jgi:hypothetical protein
MNRTKKKKEILIFLIYLFFLLKEPLKPQTNITIATGELGDFQHIQLYHLHQHTLHMHQQHTHQPSIHTLPLYQPPYQLHYQHIFR